MKKLLSLSLTILILIMTVGCGGTAYESSDAADSTIGELTADIDTEMNDVSEAVALRDSRTDPLPTRLTITRTHSKTYSAILVYDGGYIYGKDGRIGICSLDGSTDTGARYGFATGEGVHFICSDRAEKSDPKDISTLNVYGLVNTQGKELIPQRYAAITVLSQRYAKVTEVTRERSDPEGAQVKLSASNSSDGAEHYYDGNWYLYDIRTGAKIDNVGGKSPTTLNIRGNIISYTDDQGNAVCINQSSKRIPEGAQIMSDGTYVLDGEVCAASGDVIFRLAEGGFAPYIAIEGTDTYIASRYRDGESSYAVMNRSGELVSVIFKDNINVSGNIIRYKKQLYTFRGEKILEGEFDSVEYTSMLGIDIYILKGGDTLTLLDGALRSIYTGKAEDNIKTNTSHAALSREDNGALSLFCYSRGEYSISATSCGFLLGYSGKSPDFRLFDLVSGEALLTGSRALSVSVSGSDVYVVSKTASGYSFYILGK